MVLQGGKLGELVWNDPHVPLSPLDPLWDCFFTAVYALIWHNIMTTCLTLRWFPFATKKKP